MHLTLSLLYILCTSASISRVLGRECVYMKHSMCISLCVYMVSHESVSENREVKECMTV